MTQARLIYSQDLNKNILLKFLAMLFLTLSPLFLQAQTVDELLENFFRDNESASESDAQLFLENLEHLRERPLNLNTVGREDLLGIKIFNELQVENLLAYRNQFGPFLVEYELQAVPGWDLADIRRLLQFSRVKTGIDTRNTKLYEGFWKGEQELFLRWSHPDSPNYDTNKAEGGPNAWAIRYRHSFDNRLRYGFTAESDAGESLFKGSNPQGFDYYSAHLFLQNWNQRVRAVAIGDYSVRMGQGLLLQTGFAPGKSAETVSVARGGRKLNAYGAFGETYYFRGAASTLAFGKHMEVTALYSNRRRDANVVEIDTMDFQTNEEAFSSLQTSGYHRTQAEIADEKKIHEQVGGLSASWIGNRGQITANALYIAYDKPWIRSPAPYRQFVFQGQSLMGLSLDYNYRWRNTFLFGETAQSDNGGLATVNGLLFSADRHVTISAVHRSLSKDYQSIYGNPFSDASGASNEQGLYLGADIRWIRRWQLNFYTDIWRHPWLRFEVDAPSVGQEYLARLLWTKSRNFSVYALWQSENKQRNDDQGKPFGLIYAKRDRIRLHAIYKVSKPIELRSRVEWTTYQIGENKPMQGFIAYQEAVIKPLSSPISASFRYAIFDTEGYDSRVYAFENDLFAAVSIPSFSGRGTRWYLNLHWRLNRWLRLDARMEETNQNLAVTDAGKTGKERVWKIQARMKW